MCVRWGGKLQCAHTKHVVAPYKTHTNRNIIKRTRAHHFFFIAYLQYSGTNAEFTKADTVIFRTDLHNMSTGRKEYNFKRTLKYDSKWLDSKFFVPFTYVYSIYILYILPGIFYLFIYILICKDLSFSLHFIKKFKQTCK